MLQSKILINKWKLKKYNIIYICHGCIPYFFQRTFFKAPLDQWCFWQCHFITGIDKWKMVYYTCSIPNFHSVFWCPFQKYFIWKSTLKSLRYYIIDPGKFLFWGTTTLNYLLIGLSWLQDRCCFKIFTAGKLHCSKYWPTF